MKTKQYFAAFALVAVSSASTYLFTSRTTVGSAQTVNVARSADNEYQVGAVLFMQRAAEYRALAYQAFNVAQMSLDRDFDKKNLKKLPKAERKRARAVIVDVDETVLDNSPQQVDLIRRRLPFAPQLWTDWVNKRQAQAIPGAVDFLNYAARKGVRVFYVTNRNNAEKQGTIDNLKAVGFPDVSSETVIVRADSSSKEARREMIAQNYRIALLIGDNLNDLSNVFERKSVADRFAEVDKTRELFGERFIVLPNAIYGDWESAIYEYKSLPDAEKTAKRNQMLQGF